MLELGAMTNGGALVAQSVKLNGQEIDNAFTDAAALAASNLFEITLGADSMASDTITELSDTNVADYHNQPRQPLVLLQRRVELRCLR